MARAPKLSNPNELAQLASMARARAPGLSDVTMRVQTDLLISGGVPKTETAQAYQALLEALLPRIEPRTVDIVLGKLANWPHLPTGLAALIATHRPDLLHEAGLPEGPAPSAAASAGDSLALPDRKTASEMPAPPTTDEATEAMPQDTRIQDTRIIETSGSAAAIAAPSELQQLVAQARTDKALARMLACQDDLPALALTPLFADADLPARTRILMAVRRHLAIAPIAHPPRAAIPEIEQIITQMRTEPVEAAITIATILDGGEPLAAALVVDIDRTLTTLAATAIGFEPEETVRLLIVAGDDISRNTKKVLDLAELARNIEPQVALKLVAAMTGVAIARPAGRSGQTHIPQADPSGTPVRQSQATTARPARKIQWTTHLAKPAG